MEETILVRRHDRRELVGLAPAQQEEQIRQYGGRKKEEQESIAESAIHISICQVCKTGDPETRLNYPRSRRTFTAVKTKCR
jgi:hypothetical protein